jgi:membrane-bound metal-dependent hydrolase YbcI (DUF457 family)
VAVVRGGLRPGLALPRAGLAAAALVPDALRPLARRSRPAIGVLDETAHLALGALLAAGREPALARGILAASVLVDLDHAPSELGQEWLRPQARGRPYPHTAFTVLAAAAVAAVTGRALWRGVTLGLALHFARDATDAESGVRLLWPLSAHEFYAPPAMYPIAVGALWQLGR